MNLTRRPTGKPLLFAAAGTLLLLLVLLLLPVPGSGAAAIVLPAAEGTLCRAGVSIGTGDVETQVSWIPTFGVGWYLNFSVAGGTVPDGVEFTPLLAVHQPKDPLGNFLPGYTTNIPLTPEGLGVHIANNPGALWIIGNEVERIGQGEIYAEQYAVAYRDAYAFIKSQDPTAQVAPSALVQVTPNRLQYLNQVYDSYLARFGAPMPVDVWTMHLYILPEVQPDGVTPNGIASVGLGTDPTLGRRESGGDPGACAADAVYCFAEHDDIDIFAEQVLAMRTWMWAHGYQTRPLLITEYSLLYPYVQDPAGCFLQDEFGGCFTPQRVADFVVDSFAYLDGATHPGFGMPGDNQRLVQQWLWYSLNTELAGDGSDLLDESLTGLTLVGATFRDEVLRRPLVANLAAEAATATAIAGGEAAQLTVTVRNNGNTGVDESFQVAFYSEADDRLIGTVTVPALDGCARRTVTATVEWADLAAGTHHYRAVVDAGDDIAESSESDNIATGFVLVDPPTRLLLPLLPRALAPGS